MVLDENLFEAKGFIGTQAGEVRGEYKKRDEETLPDKVAREIENLVVKATRPDGTKIFKTMTAFSDPNVDNGYYFKTKSQKLAQKGKDVLDKYNIAYTDKDGIVSWEFTDDQLGELDLSKVSAKTKELFKEEFDGNWFYTYQALKNVGSVQDYSEEFEFEDEAINFAKDHDYEKVVKYYYPIIDNADETWDFIDYVNYGHPKYNEEIWNYADNLNEAYREPVDDMAADELTLYIVNDSYLYNHYSIPVIKNLTRKKIKGIFNKELAVKAFEHVAKAGADEYYKEFGDTFNPATRNAVAKNLLDRYEEYIDELVKDPKKLEEDIEKTKSGKWVNRGKEGTHGEFKTKKAAREQQKAMFARGFKGESIYQADSISGNKMTFEITEDSKLIVKDGEKVVLNTKVADVQDAKNQISSMKNIEILQEKYTPEQQEVLDAFYKDMDFGFDSNRVIIDKVTSDTVEFTLDGVSDVYKLNKELKEDLEREFTIFFSREGFGYGSYGAVRVKATNEDEAKSKFYVDKKDDKVEIEFIRPTENQDIKKGIRLIEDLNEEPNAEEKIDPKAGLETVLNDLINDENEAINGYNSAIVNFELEGKSELTEVFRDIIKDEQNHIGNLQKLLNEINPGTIENIQDGQEEAEKTLDN